MHTCKQHPCPMHAASGSEIEAIPRIHCTAALAACRAQSARPSLVHPLLDLLSPEMTWRVCQQLIVCVCRCGLGSVY